MNEYEECLYNYIMENKFRELLDSREYITLRRAAKKCRVCAGSDLNSRTEVAV